MGIRCTFVLNSRPISALVCEGVGTFPAFSGLADDRNKPDATGKAESGPLPTGRYYIVDRRSGGRLGWLYDFLKDQVSESDRHSWFALYRADGVVDDETMVGQIKRGAFRLHPIGRLGISEGCITLLQPHQFATLRERLIAGGHSVVVPRSAVTAYGTVDVTAP